VAGYSGTPLVQKLGIKPGTKLYVVSAPENYPSLLAPLPEGVALTRGISAQVDVIHLFVTSRAVLAAELGRCAAKMRPDAAIWVSWPKKAAKVSTDITEDVIRAEALPLGLVDIKVCAVDAVWSGLKVVIRKENRPTRNR
jgi:hypothetical protein